MLLPGRRSPQKGTHKSGPHFSLRLKRTPGPAGYFRYNSRQPCNRSSPQDKTLPAGIYGVYVHRKRHGEHKRQNRHAINLCAVTHCQHLTPSKRCSMQRCTGKPRHPGTVSFSSFSVISTRVNAAANPCSRATKPANIRGRPIRTNPKMGLWSTKGKAAARQSADSPRGMRNAAAIRLL